MQENFNKTKIYSQDHTTYGGKLSSFDFDGHHTMATMAKKISYDHIFDNQCQKNIKLKNDNNKKNIGSKLEIVKK